ncbi:MAG TPA: VanZ family protein [Gemmatimonadaceae bacterium]|nr:VanZ family protein [Gemmatimonadaceae bacterium]
MRTGVTITVLALAAIVVATLRPDSNPPLPSHWCLICGSQGGVDAILNVLLFIPLGVGLSLAGARARHVVLSGLLLSALIETAQLTVIAGRDATVGDIIANTCGAALGYAAANYSVVLFRPSARAAMALIGAWSFVWLALSAALSFAFVQAVPGSYFYGQLGRRLGNFDWFNGQVLSAQVGSARITDSRIDSSETMSERLMEGIPLTAAVVPGDPTTRIAPIVRVVDSAGSEAVMLGQLGSMLVLRPATGARIIKLRAPIFGAARVFERRPRDPGSSAGTAPTAQRLSPSINLVAQYNSMATLLQGTSAYASIQKRIPVRATLGWIALLPFQWIVEGSRWELVISAAWIGCLVLLPGYWSAFTGIPDQPRSFSLPSLVWPLLILVVVYAGMDAMPRILRVGVAGIPEWFIAVAAIFSAHLIGRLVTSRLGSSSGTASVT